MEYITKISDAGSIAVDDTILVKGVLCSAGSHILEGFKPLFSAEAVERVEKAGYEISGKTNVGEFGLDLVGEFSYYGEQSVKGAAAELVKKGEVKAALNVDLNGAPRRAAALAGVDFLKPTYGTVSRYGIIPCACSGEQVGVTAAKAEDIADILSVIAGHDSKDGTSLPAEKYEYALDKDVSAMKVCIVKELMDAASADVQAKVLAYAAKLEKLGAAVETVSFEMVKAAQSAWQILMAAETCNNVSRYDGVKFGYRTPNYRNIDELYVGTRTEGMNFLTKATILYGSDVLSKGRYLDCYDKSLKIRRLAQESVKALLAKYDAILCPACGEAEYAPYAIEDAFTKVFGESLYTAVANLTGIPAMVSGGIQLMADMFGESTLLSIAASVEKEAE